MTLARALFVLPLVLFMAAPADAATKHRKHAAHAGSWDGRWVGAWGGSQPTAQIIKGGKVVAFEYNGETHAVAHSHVTPTRIVYSHQDAVVTMTRTGANTAHATLKSGQGDGTAELTRQ
jgi:hypothetical protein